MSYRVKFLKRVSGCEHDDDNPDCVWLKRDMELDIVPFCGLVVEDGDWNEFCEDVWWDNREKLFRVFTVRDDEIEKANLLGKDHRSLDDIVNEYIEQGWEEDD